MRDAIFQTMGLQLGQFNAERRVLNTNPQLPVQQHEYLGRIFPRMNEIVAGIYDGTRENPIVDAIVLAEEIRRDAPARPNLPPLILPPLNLQQLILEEQIQVARGILNIPMPPPAPRLRALPQGELARFVQDNQNVHTEVSVRQTKDVIACVLRIPVPAEYKSPSLKTMGEIVLECPMTKKAAFQFTSKYCADEDIYEYGAGIYARVTDCVWQYIKNSPDKADLCKIFAQEMEDSIGMCAQGNLTRLCNVLSGYLEGVNMESTGEQLQRRMALLMEVDRPEDRLAQGRALLEELHIPNAEWRAWLDALA